MEPFQVITGVLVDEPDKILSFTDICHVYQIPEDTLTELLEHGLLGHVTKPLAQVDFDLHMVHRIQSARRLQGDLGVNTPGVVLVLELRDALMALRSEIEILRRHVGDVL
ncbi:MAG TPA: molecular chaperone [Legionella sp.]|nr:molecular chaperone [Legionella sp.]